MLRVNSKTKSWPELQASKTQARPSDCTKTTPYLKTRRQNVLNHLLEWSKSWFQTSSLGFNKAKPNDLRMVDVLAWEFSVDIERQHPFRFACSIEKDFAEAMMLCCSRPWWYLTGRWYRILAGMECDGVGWRRFYCQIRKALLSQMESDIRFSVDVYLPPIFMLGRQAALILH